MNETTDKNKDYDKLVKEWHNSDSELRLFEYLGMTKEEYAEWMLTGEIKKDKNKGE